MNPNEYQKLAQRTECNEIRAVERMGDGYFESREELKSDDLPSVRITHAILGMTNEVGEICKMFKGHIYHGKPLDRTNIAEELGDLMWYVALACNATGLSLADVMAANIRKLQVRYPEKYTDELSANRETQAELSALEEVLNSPLPSERIAAKREAVNSRISQSGIDCDRMVDENGVRIYPNQPPIEESGIGCAHWWSPVGVLGDFPEYQCVKCGELKVG